MLKKIITDNIRVNEYISIMSRIQRAVMILFPVLLFVIPVFLAAHPDDSGTAADASLLNVNLLPHARMYRGSQTGQKISDEKLEVSDFEKLPAERFEGGGEIISFGFSDDSHLFLISVVNPLKEPLARLLVFNPTWLDHIDVTLIHPSGEREFYSGGDYLAFDHRSIEHGKINFNLTFEPGVSQLLVNTKTGDPYLVGMSLWERSAFYRQDGYQKLYNGFIYGILIAMLLYNLVLFLSIRENVYASYVNYILFFILMHSTYNGHLYGLFWPSFPLWSNWAHSIFIYMFIGSGIYFLISFLDLKKLMKKNYRLACGFALVLIASFFITAAVGYSLHVRSSILWVFVYTPFVLYVGFASLISGNQSARYFLTAAVAGFIGSFVTALTVTGIIPFRFYTYHAVDFGMLLDAVLLSFALADRLRLARGEADRVRSQLNDVTMSQAKNLEKEIAVRTLELEDLNRQLKELSLLDPLTGIGNRRKFSETLEKEWSVHLRNHRCISLLICDVDYFKQYNDHYGHPAGDECLKIIAASIQSVVTRPADLISRFGGEEFAVILPETDHRGACYVAEKIRRKIESLHMEHEFSSVSGYVTISIGFDGMIPSDTLSIDRMVKQADEALYRAKNSGRNNVKGPKDFMP